MNHIIAFLIAALIVGGVYATIMTMIEVIYEKIKTIIKRKNNKGDNDG